MLLCQLYVNITHSKMCLQKTTYAFRCWAALESEVRFLSIGLPMPMGGGIPGDIPGLDMPETVKQM